MERVKKFLWDESAVSAMEYGLIGTLISLAIMSGATWLGQRVNDCYTKAAGKF